MSAGGPLHIGRTLAESTGAPSPLRRPPVGAPNVVLVVLDDLGFGQLGCFGAPIATPAIDALAARGLRYRCFHVTALCSPTRACLLTGRNHHAVGMGFLPDVPISFPGYNGRIPPSAGTLPRILREEGYSTFAVGKWHLTPRWEISASGPFERWPLGLGFERYYGFLGGDTNQWAPELVRDNSFVDPPRTPEEGYHLTEDLVDQAIRMVQDQQQATPGKPFFLYLATGAAHAPHHVPAEWTERYRGAFDDGWESYREQTFARQLEMGVVPAGTRCTDRPPWVPAWSSLGGAERRLFARMMEVFAGFVSHTDHQIGRLVSFLDAWGLLDRTLVIICSDNGASAEGGPHGSLNEHRFTHDMLDELADTIARIDDLGGTRAYNHYAWGWAWAGNTPFRLWKRFTWLGGVRTPLVVHWPRDVADPGAVRPQFCHAVDVMPTVLDVAGIEVPAVLDGVSQQPLDGASIAPTFADPGAPSPRRTQYFEMLGSRAIYHDGWKAVTDHVGRQLSVERELVAGSHDFEADRWSLFHLAHDFAEATDLSDRHPERVRQMVELWWAEAGRNMVLPLDDSLVHRAVAMEPPPFERRRRAVLRPGGGGVAEDTLPSMVGGFTLRVRVAVGEAAEGILCALGDWNNGFAFYLLDGRPVFAVSLFGDVHRVAAAEAVAAGSHELSVAYRRAREGGGPLSLGVDGQTVAEGLLSADLPFRWQIAGAGLLVGRDRGLPVSDDYHPPFPFSGVIHELVLESGAPVPATAEVEVAAVLRHE